MTERIGRVLPERSALRVSRATVEGERLRLMDAGLEAHPLEAFPRGLLLDAHQDRAPQFLPAGPGMHEHAFHFAVAGRIDAQRAAAEGEAVGCGALRIDSTGYGEVKRMFVHPGARGQKLGRAILMRIEEQASREGLKWMRLETGIHQAEALALYRGAGYAERGPFGEYTSDPLSHFLEKVL